MAQIDEVIKACGYTEYHKETIQPYYNDALEYLRGAGVKEEIINSDKAVGCIARYVLDTYNLNSNAVDLSPFFFRRLKQLQLEGVTADAEKQEG